MITRVCENQTLALNAPGVTSISIPGIPLSAYDRVTTQLVIKSIGGSVPNINRLRVQPVVAFVGGQYVPVGPDIQATTVGTTVATHIVVGPLLGYVIAFDSLGPTAGVSIICFDLVLCLDRA